MSGVIQEYPQVTGTNTGDQTITLTGPVTGSGTGSFATTITNSAVTYAKIQNVSATDRILGRQTAGAGIVEEIVCTAAGRALIAGATAAAQRTTLGLGTIATQNANSVAITGGSITGITDLAIADGGTGQSTAILGFNALSPLTTKGDIIARDATNNIRLPVGTNGQVLVADSTQASGIKWSNAGSGIIRYINVQFRNNNTYNGYVVSSVGSNNSDIITFTIPSDALAISSVRVYCFVSSGAAQAARNIDFTANFAGPNEVYNIHSSSLTVPTYDLTGYADKAYFFEIIAMFGSLAGGDTVGLTVKNNSVGGSIYYHSVVATITT